MMNTKKTAHKDGWLVIPYEIEHDEDREPGHAFGCICADCSGAELTADND